MRLVLEWSSWALRQTVMYSKHVQMSLSGPLQCHKALLYVFTACLLYLVEHVSVGAV